MNRFRFIVFVAVAVLMAHPQVTLGQTVGLMANTPPEVKAYNPRDLSGVWRLPATPKSNLLFKSPNPEPPLTDWAKAHMFPGGITHGDHITVSGGFPGQNCEPIGIPAQYSYLRFYPFEMIQLPDRIIQIFELHREWRYIWLNQDHPKDLFPTYMGDSVGHWEGNTLVVDTTGFNGKDFITEDVPHPMSNQFHLIERYTRPSYDTLKIDMTFYDPKAWGDKPWTGFSRTLKLAHDRLQEWICDPAVDAQFNQKIMKPVYGSTGLDLPSATPKK